jgi:Lon protease-like protein
VNNRIDLPLFPLNTVLFPGMVLPLHVFEERYKAMISHCLEDEQPFGVVLIREGKEVGGEAVPYAVGTTAVIASVSHLQEGRMNIVAVGNERFRLESLRHDRPYLVGRASPWPLTGGESVQARRQVGAMRALLQQYLTLLAQAQGHKIEIGEVPAEPLALALTIAIALQLPMSQRQNLLCQPTVTELLLTERSILRREQLLLAHIVHTQAEQWEGGFSGLLARN